MGYLTSENSTESKRTPDYFATLKVIFCVRTQNLIKDEKQWVVQLLCTPLNCFLSASFISGMLGFSFVSYHLLMTTLSCQSWLNF